MPFYPPFYVLFQQKNACKCLLIAVLWLSGSVLQAQNNLWLPAQENNSLERSAFIPDLPAFDKGALMQLDLPAMQNLAQTAPMEFGSAGNTLTTIRLPLPDGSLQQFRIWESPLMEPGLAAKFPEIKTYLLKGIDDPLAVGRMSVSPDEFGAYFTSRQYGQEVFIRKVLKNSASLYFSYWGKDDLSWQRPMPCLWENSPEPSRHQETNLKPGPNETGDVLRVFRLAMTLTGALSEGYGWTTKAQAMSALVAFLGQLNVIYERDLSVRFVLPEKQDNLIFLSAAGDPFTALGGGEAASENLVVANQLIGQEGFDVGLIFVTGACCAAGKPTICGDFKAFNFSAFYSLRVTAHEIGHQFDADHTWTSCGPSNNGQFGTNEYGSGTTIMSYAYICGVDNILPVGDENYFGVYSQIQMTNHINARTCYKTLETGNHIPVSSVPAGGFYIPISTPFELVGTASDVDGDDLSYSWEQTNVRNIDFTATNISIQTPPVPADGNVPLARIFNPVNTPRRTIPQLPDLLSNTSSVNERLPTYSRNIKYRMYVRDNHPGAGGTTHEQVSFEVDGGAGPFLVSLPNTCVTWPAGSSQIVAWEVANTNNNLVNCQQVTISLSVDGGYHYPYILAANTPNDGSEVITLPAGICSNKSRIKVAAADNIFFDVSNADFNIENNNTPIVKANALLLDGVDDQVEIQNANLGNFGTGEFTMEMWIQTTDNNCALIGKRAICNCDNFWNFFLENGRLRAEFSASNTCNGYLNVAGQNNTLANGAWHHVAFVRKGTTLQLYVDGVLDLSVASSQDFNNPAKITLGNIVCGGQNFAGNMDEIRIWSISRTVAEINEKMNCTLEGNEPGLLAYYPVSSQDCGVCSSGANVFTDQSANGNHGLMQNGAATMLSTANITGCPNCPFGPISITSQPASQSVPLGSTATFAVNVSGDNLSYQWYISTNGGVTFVAIPGATGPEYSVEVTSSARNGQQFQCFLSNGCDLTTSNPATLSLPCPPQTLSSITGPANPCANNYYTYFVTPNPNIVSWTWTSPPGWSVTLYDNMIFVKTDAGSGVISVTGIDACGATTNTQTMQVTPVVVSIQSQPVAQSVDENEPVQFSVSVSAAGGPSTYAWQESVDNGQTYIFIPGANTETYAIAAAGISLDGRLYRCIVANACLTDTSEAVSLQVQCLGTAPDKPGAIAGATKVCADATLSYAITPVAGATEYVWTLPFGWTGNSSTNEITVSTNGNGGVLKVRAVNNCGASEDEQLTVSGNQDPCRRAIHFDGVDDYLSIAQNGEVLSGDWSISFWMKPDRLLGEQTLIFNGREWIIGLSGDQIRYKHSDDCCGYDNTVDMLVSSGSIQSGKWINVVITRETENRTVYFYLNGNLIATRTYGGSFAQPGNNTNDMVFGAGKNGAWANFEGSLDEIKIWSGVRTAEELKQDLVCYPTGNEPNLKAYYDFETGQPFGDNTGVASFAGVAGNYGAATVQNMSMSGTVSNVISGDLPSLLYQDQDGDGFGGTGVGCNYTGPTATNAKDCDDQNSAVNPEAVEVCNGLDDDCSGAIDDLPVVLPSADVPVFIPANTTITSTLEVSNLPNVLVDVNVMNLDITHIWVGDLTIKLSSPQGTEITLVNAICGDQDNMLLNFDDDTQLAYSAIPCPPTDNGVYRPLNPLSAFHGENPNGTWTLTVADVYEDAGTLNNWSLRFQTVSPTLYVDADGDGFGDPDSGVLACAAQAGYVADHTDCNDQNNQIYPGAPELCNGADDDCDGLTDEGVGPIWYADADGDGFGTTVNQQQDCNQPTGYVSNSEDCDDSNAGINPNALELANNLDDDCDGLVDDSINVRVTELWSQAKDIRFSLQPNPADEQLQVVFTGEDQAMGQLEIFNPLGQRMQVQEIRVAPGTKVILSIGWLPQGNYFLVFRSEDGTISGKRFVVLR